MRHYVALGVVASAALIVHALHYREAWIDDAFITFRYARNLWTGAGLVFNAGERVEGITNLGWAVLLAPFAGSDPLGAARILGLSAAVATVGVLTGWCRWAGLSLPVTAAVLLGVVAVPWVPSWSMLGLETTAVMFGVTLAWTRHGVEAAAGRRTWLAGLAMALTPVLRPDAALVPAVVGLWHLWTRRGATPRAVGAAGIVAGGALALVAVKWAWFGAVLPRTFGVKVNAWPPERGYTWIANLLRVGAPLFPLLLAAGLAWGLVRAARRDDRALPALVALVWTAAMVALNGDFMPNFRLLVPAWPAACAALGVALQDATARRGRLVGALAFGAVGVGLLPQAQIGLADRLDTAVALDAPGLRKRAALWAPWGSPAWGQGMTGHAPFAVAWTLVNAGPESTVAFGDVGLFGYLNDVRVVDLLGLTDGELPALADPLARARSYRERVDWLIVDTPSALWAQLRDELAADGWQMIAACDATWVLANPDRRAAAPDTATRLSRLQQARKRAPDAAFLDEVVAQELARAGAGVELDAWLARAPVDAARRIRCGLGEGPGCTASPDACAGNGRRQDPSRYASAADWPSAPRGPDTSVPPRGGGAPRAAGTEPRVGPSDGAASPIALPDPRCGEARAHARTEWTAVQAAMGGPERARQLVRRAAARTLASPEDALSAAEAAAAALAGTAVEAHALRAVAATASIAAACVPPDPGTP